MLQHGHLLTVLVVGGAGVAVGATRHLRAGVVGLGLLAGLHVARRDALAVAVAGPGDLGAPHTRRAGAAVATGQPGAGVGHTGAAAHRLRRVAAVAGDAVEEVGRAGLALAAVRRAHAGGLAERRLVIHVVGARAVRVAPVLQHGPLLTVLVVGGAGVAAGATGQVRAGVVGQGLLAAQVPHGRDAVAVAVAGPGDLRARHPGGAVTVVAAGQAVTGVGLAGATACHVARARPHAVAIAVTELGRTHLVRGAIFRAEAHHRGRATAVVRSGPTVVGGGAVGAHGDVVVGGVSGGVAGGAVGAHGDVGAGVRRRRRVVPSTGGEAEDQGERKDRVAKGHIKLRG